MISLQQPSRSPLARVVARALIVALTLALLPAPVAAARAADGSSFLAVITDGYTYSAFGELLAHTGSDPQPYAFTGEPYDPNVGFQYHRARWMDPRVGRFVGMDPFEGLTHEPLTLHRYLYANADPPNRIDPSGALSFVQQLAVGAIIGIIVNIAIVQPRTATETAEAAVVGAIVGAGGVALGALAIEIALLLRLASVIVITPYALRHVIDRHTYGGAQNINASTFWAHFTVKNLIGFIRAAESTPAVQQANGNLARVVYAGQTVGIDRTTGLPTSFYTVITTRFERLVTMFPGLPAN